MVFDLGYIGPGVVLPIAIQASGFGVMTDKAEPSIALGAKSN